MKSEEEMEIKVWVDLCDDHARMLIDEEDWEGVNRLGESDWPCLVEDCEEAATVQGQVRVSPPFKKVLGK
jgi:hypothetical protein